MKKLLLLAAAASLSFAAFAVPSVDPTPGAITLVFQVPTGMECTPVIQFVGDASDPSWTPGSEVNPVAVATGEDGWYKLVLIADYNEGKIVPNNIDGTSGWKYQGKYTQVEGYEVDWLSINGESEHQLNFNAAEGKSGGVAYLNVTQWNANPCDAANPEGEATFTMTCEIPETADPTEATVYVEGNGSGAAWGQLAELIYDDRSSAFSGSGTVPAGCSYKYVISYKGGNKIYMKGDNLNMPYNLVADDEVTEWDSDPWVEPLPGGEGTFSVTFTGECQPSTASNDSVFIAGNFEDTPDWERVYYMEQGEGESANKWTVTDLAYPEGFMFKFVVKYDLGGEEYEEKWVPADNITFDGETFDYEFEGPCKEVAAEEVAADAKANTYKFIENGMIFINANGVIYNMQGVPVK